MSITKTDNSGVLNFKFDKIFEGDVTQVTVFKEMGPLIQSVLDGFIVCVLVYGQSGSGKRIQWKGDRPAILWASLHVPFNIFLIHFHSRYADKVTELKEKTEAEDELDSLIFQL
ncbi:non-claret disjunctional [Carabus blaptoides fortunei]